MDGIHLISTGKQTTDQLIEKVLDVHLRVDYIHLREKSWSAKEYIRVINELVARGISRKKIIINDRIDIAVANELLGVQLKAHGINPQQVKQHYPQLKIGCSVHSIAEAKEKEASGADFLLYGHIFKTASKADLQPRGLKNLKEIVNQVCLPVIAIGGIQPSNVNEVLQTGAVGIAVLSGILLAKDVKQASLQYEKKINEAR